MELRKEIQKDGDSFKLRITKKEMMLYNHKVGDILIVKTKEEQNDE